MDTRKHSFTSEQVPIIRHPGGHALVSAVAGSGKSTTMVERVAHLVEHGEDPGRILVIQYNKSAQVSMDRKLKERLPSGGAPKARTFHSIGLEMRKRLVELKVLPVARLVTSGVAQERAARQALRAAWSKHYGKDSYAPQEITEQFKEFVTRAKSDIRDAADVYRDGGYSGDTSVFPTAFEILMQEAQSQGVIYYDDLLYHPLQALKEDPDLWWYFAGSRAKGQPRYGHIIVDEFQDINSIQFYALQGLAGLVPFSVPRDEFELEPAEDGLLPPVSSTTSVMVVGDPDQAIYSWRGSDVSYITRYFAETFTPCQRYQLTRTFRYGHTTALLANHIITRNRERDDKITVAAPSNADTKITRLQYLPKQPTGLVRAIDRAHREHKLHRGAMLVRFYSMSIPYEIELTEAGIPFHVYGRAPLTHLPEIAAMVSSLSISSNYWTIEEDLLPIFFRSLVMFPSLFLPAHIIEQATDRMVLDYGRGLPLSRSIRDFCGSLGQGNNAGHANAQARSRLLERASIIELLEGPGMRTYKPGRAIEAYLKLTGYLDKLKSGAIKAEEEEARRNVTAFVEMTNRFENAKDLLDLVGPMAAFREDSPPKEDHLSIMSCHRAKGLEWPTVILPGWVAGVFPRDAENLEEERRLAYVAVTRAINHLVFIHPVDEAFNDINVNLAESPLLAAIQVSPFLVDAEPGLCVRASEAIRSGQPTEITCRRSDIINRYAGEIGLDTLEAKTPPSLAAQLQSQATGPLNLTEGDHLVSPDKHRYVVRGKINDMLYRIEPLSGGDPRYITANEPGWILILRAVPAAAGQAARQ